MSRDDPYHVCRFRVELNHVEHGGFAHVKGLTREIKVDGHWEGGLNEFEHKLASHTTYGPLTLERGFADDYLWSWNARVAEGSIERRDVTILLHDSSGAPVWRWVVDRAYPVKWTGTDLDAASGQVLIESVELAHHGIHGERM